MNQQEAKKQSGQHNSSYPATDLKNRLKQDILNGLYPPAKALPYYKELRFRYKTSFRTLKAVLDDLYREGLLKRHKRSYEPVLTASAPSRSRIRIFAPAVGGKSIAASICSQNTTYLIETTCRRHGVLPEFYGYGSTYTVEPFEKLDIHGSCRFLPMGSSEFIALEDDDDILGYILLITARTIDDDFIFRWIAHVKDKPVIICDAVGNVKVRSRLHHPNMRIFTVASSARIGAHAARFLLEKGCKHVAYISPFHQALWSIHRLQGLNEIYRSAGKGHSVSIFTYNNPPSVHDFYSRQALDTCDPRSLQAAFERWSQQAPETAVRAVRPIFEFQLPCRVLPQAMLVQSLETLFDKALAHERISAWMCANDTVALNALQYLERKGIAVPGTLQIIGFDDSEAAHEHRLTSYNFHLDMVVTRMVNAVLDPRLLPRSRTPVEIEGMIIERSLSK
ncbi:MAG: GntR family transcriptional regulator [Chitinivibrionales bacterium]|nr:GntR family transcriptional regulator [Chitinivibrionales bacterium]